MNAVSSLRPAVRALGPLVAVFAIVASPAAAGDGDGGELSPYLPPRKLAVLADKQISESSGLARCISRPGLLWTHNDSGDRPRLFLFDEAGNTAATFAVPGAEAVDWEDLCSFRRNGRNYLLVGDVGDNNARRDLVQLYLIEEPPARQLERPRDGNLQLSRTIEFSYEDGPRDCEAVAVDATTGHVYLVSKQLSMSCTVYRLALPDGERRGGQVARRVATLELPIAVAMDIAPDASRAVVLTYFEAFEYPRMGAEPLSAAFSRPGRRLPMPLRRQGETICYGPDGRSLYLTSEGSGQPLWKLPARPPAAP